MAKRAAPWIPSRPWTDTLSPPHLRGQSWGDTHIFTFCPQHEEGKQRDFRQKHGLPVYLEKSEALARSSQTQPVRPGSQCSRPPLPNPEGWPRFTLGPTSVLASSASWHRGPQSPRALLCPVVSVPSTPCASPSLGPGPGPG